MGVLVRPTGARDCPAIDELCTHLHGKAAGASKLLDTALLCLTAVTDDKDSVVGFICLDHAPTMLFGSKYSTEHIEAVARVPEVGLNATTSAFIWVYAVAPQYEAQTSLALLRGVMAAMPIIKSLLVATTAGTGVPAKGLASLVMPMVQFAGWPVQIAQVTRGELLPQLNLRAARVEDHDDMLPVLERAEARFPALAKLPESSRPQEAFALTRVVAGQDDNNVVLVAHEAHAPGGVAAAAGLVGFMVVTSEVDVTPLADAFDLHPYDSFLPEDVYEAQYNAARDALRIKKRNTLEAKLGDRVLRAPQQEQQQQHTADASTQAVEGGDAGAGEDGAAEGAGQEGAAAAQQEEQIDITAASEPTDDEVKAEMAAMFDLSEQTSTVFAITMACIDPEFDAQTEDFLRRAFEAFPDKLYCLLTLPHDSPEPPLVAPFTRLTPLPGAAFPEVLYLFHRHALNESFDVRLAAERDAEGVSLLISGMPNSSDIKELFGAALERGTAVVAVASGEVVGLVTISEAVDVPLLEANFSLSSLIYLPHHPPEAHGEIDMVCINPIFSHRARAVLSGAQRLLNKSVLYYALPPGQPPPPEVLDVMMQVPPRHRGAAAPAGGAAGDEAPPAEFALYMLSRRHAFVARQAVNAQLVVVGASETGLAAVERLLLDVDLCFNYVTLLAPGGISVAGLTNEYSSSVISKLGLDARVTLVDAEMVGLDKQNRVIELSDGSQLVYDMLIITSGLQEQSCNELAETEPEVAAVVLNALELSSGFTVGDAVAMQTMMVYGDTLDAYLAMATLDANGAEGKYLFYKAPGQQDAFVSVLKQCATSVGLALPDAQVAALYGVEPIENSKQKAVVIQAPDGVTKEQLPVDLVVGCQPHKASRTVFMCLNNAGVVYDGRVVVDNCFRTSDPQIYAAGTVAKLSRRFGRNINFEHYNSRDVGTALANSIIAAFQGQPPPTAAPTLGQQQTRVVGCPVPGGYLFVYAGVPAAMASPSLAVPPHGRALHTVSDRGTLHLLLDAGGSVHSVVYLGKAQIPVQKFSSLVGLHASYLNGLVAKYDAGKVACLINFLTMEPWTELLFHEHFLQFRHQQLLFGLESMGLGAKLPEVLRAAQDAVLEFTHSRAAELPGFAAAVPVQ